MSSSSLSVLIDTVKYAINNLVNYATTGKLDTKAIGEAVKVTTAAFNSNPNMSDADKKTMEEATKTAMDGLNGEESKKGSEEGEGGKANENSENDESKKKNEGNLAFIGTLLDMFAKFLQAQQNQSNEQQNQNAQPSWIDMLLELATRFMAMQNSTANKAPESVLPKVEATAEAAAKSQPVAGVKASKAGAAQASQSKGASKQGGVIRTIGNSVESYSGKNMNVSMTQGSNGSFEATVENRETGKTAQLRRDQSGNITIDGHTLGNYPQDQLLEILPSPEGLIINGKNIAVSDQGLKEVPEAKSETGSKQESSSEKDTLSAAASEGGARMQEELAKESKLKEQGLQYNKSADGKSGVLTPDLKAGESAPSYSAHFTFGENGSVTATVTGPDFEQGTKAVLQQFKDAGINTVEMSGPRVESSEGAYNAIKMADDMGVTAIIADKGILGSAKAFAEGAEKANPGGTAGNEAATRDYLENMAGNDELRQKMIEEMADNGLGTKEELGNKTTQELADEAFDNMPKSGAEVQAKMEEPKPKPASDDTEDTGPALDTELDDRVDTEAEEVDAKVETDLKTGSGPKPGAEQSAEAAVAEEGAKAVTSLAGGEGASASAPSGGSAASGHSVSTGSAPKEKNAHQDSLLAAAPKRYAENDMQAAKRLSPGGGGTPNDMQAVKGLSPGGGGTPDDKEEDQKNSMSRPASGG